MPHIAGHAPQVLEITYPILCFQPNRLRDNPAVQRDENLEGVSRGDAKATIRQL